MSRHLGDRRALEPSIRTEISKSKESHLLALSPAMVARALGATVVLLILASVAGQIATLGFGHDEVKGLVRLFNVSEEGNVPTYFSVLQMFIAACLLAATAVIDRHRRVPLWWTWPALSLGFLFMGFDEAFQVHEQLTDLVRGVLGDGTLGVFYYSWVIPGIALVLALTMFFLPFWTKLPGPTRWRFVMAAAIYLGGCIGMEMVGGRFAELHGTDNWRYSMMTTTEESLEMVGVTFFIWAILQYLGDKGMEIRIVRREPLGPRQSVV